MTKLKNQIVTKLKNSNCDSRNSDITDAILSMFYILFFNYSYLILYLLEVPKIRYNFLFFKCLEMWTNLWYLWKSCKMANYPPLSSPENSISFFYLIAFLCSTEFMGCKCIGKYFTAFPTDTKSWQKVAEVASKTIAFIWNTTKD